MMSQVRAHVALLVDFAAIRDHVARVVEAPAKPRSKKSAEPDPGLPPLADLARGLVRYATQVGRLAFARAYADWTKEPQAARDLASSRIEPVLVPTRGEEVASSPLRLAVDALQALYAGDEPDAFVLVVKDATLLPLVQALRTDGSEVVLIAPADQVPAELKEEADRFVSLQDVVAGAAAEPIAPRAFRSARGETAAEPRAAAAAAPRPADDAARRDRTPHPTPIRSDDDFATYDWGPFIKLIDELEHRLPFVGVRYLVNKVLGPHNCGVDDPRLKRDLINRAVDDGIIEMYPVGNVGDRADPVTACRLDRRNTAVVQILGQTTAPEPPAEVPGGAPLGADLEHENASQED